MELTRNIKYENTPNVKICSRKNYRWFDFIVSSLFNKEVKIKPDELNGKKCLECFKIS